MFADACLARGDAEAAIAKAREGIAVADAGGAWFQAALARAVLVDALVRAGAPEHEVAAVITEARELVRKSGGNSLLPRLREAEARLAGRNDRTILASRAARGRGHVPRHGRAGSRRAPGAGAGAVTCDACGFENPAGMKLCGECAAPLASRCPACGSENPPGFKFWARSSSAS